MITIRQNGDRWDLVQGDHVLGSFGTYGEAVGQLAAMLNDGRVDVETGRLAVVDTTEEGADPAGPGDGLLPETWHSPVGVAFSDSIEDGFRDFTQCAWSWRDPGAGIVPLMLQTETEMGHYGAQLAGFVVEFSQANGVVGARGRFYASESGEQFRDMVLGGRSFGVSVDPGHVIVEEECIEVDDDGWCDRWSLHFMEYEIIGVTGTPFPGFAQAGITIDTAAVAASAGNIDCACGGTCNTCAAPGAQARAHLSTMAARVARLERPAAVVAGGAVITREPVRVATEPPRSWFTDPALPCPTPPTITREGRVLGHVAVFNDPTTGQPICHTGQDDYCLMVPRGGDYRDFHQGGTITDDGRVPTGALTWGIPHAGLTLSMIAAQVHYADSRYGWADVCVGEDRFGVWYSGALRPGLFDDDLRILRSLATSGDWRMARRNGRHELIAALSVNYPGFPNPSVTASVGTIETLRPRSLQVDGEVLAIVASGMVRPGNGPDDRRIAVIEAHVQRLERQLAAPARARLAERRRDLAASRLRR